VHARGTTRA